VTVADGATAKEIKAVFVTLPLVQQQTAFSACGALLPPRQRLKIQALIAGETSSSTSSL